MAHTASKQVSEEGEHIMTVGPLHAAGRARENTSAPLPPGPDMMLGLWTSWVESAAKLAGAQGASGQAKPGVISWQVSPTQLAGSLIQGGVRQPGEMLAKDPILRATEEALNANPLRQVVPVDWAEIVRALRTVWLRSISRPDKAIAAAVDFNARLWQSAVDTWNETGQRWLGLGQPDAPPVPPGSGDKRFAAPEWQGNPAYRTLKELYLLASDWLLHQTSEADDLSPAERQRLDFHLRQFVDAMSPTLLLASNPAALRRAVETGGTSLAEGVRNLLRDLKEGKLRMVDTTAFAPGRNLALTPGKVVYRNKLIELIQYSSSTDTVHQIPLVIIPPWINKYYIMDMQPKNSMVRFLVEQGFTVFMLSWRNPDASMEDTTFEEYMDLGPLAASDAVREITGSPTVNVMGYCIGGTLLAMTLAWLATKGDDRFNSATFMVSLQDFANVGDTAVFLGEPTIDFIEQQMMERGYLDSREMSNMFNLLRSNDLIWSNVVNNYLLGQKPPAFDLLYWNSDGTRMARAAHAWYLRNTYSENSLMHPGKVHLKGEALDLGRIRLDSYAVGAEKDHIVPWGAAWRITQLVGGWVRFVLASSGHIAGMINPPGGKGTYWTGEGQAETPDAWRKAADHCDGSWWTDWRHWLAAHAGERVAPPSVGSAAYPPLLDAPGRYVLEK
ncbi:MAG: poly[(R)-3-hydroxyalkanoate] polymerase subunit PhaC [Acetobacteraceae bacterium]|nr:poly[(R)-3-hydroxyalkanoate] polymerase subunit PhaC [Acetobacteraceae bacterium]